MEQVIRAEEQKVKVFKVSDPNQIRYVTKVAAGYLTPKWAIADIQDQPKKSEAVKAVGETEVKDVKPELRAKYKEISGQDADERWNTARLYIEISKAQTAGLKAEPQAQSKVEQPEQPKPKRKYTKRQPAIA